MKCNKNLGHFICFIEFGNIALWPFLWNYQELINNVRVVLEFPISGGSNPCSVGQLLLSGILAFFWWGPSLLVKIKTRFAAVIVIPKRQKSDRVVQYQDGRAGSRDPGANRIPFTKQDTMRPLSWGKWHLEVGDSCLVIVVASMVIPCRLTGFGRRAHFSSDCDFWVHCSNALNWYD